MPNSQQAIVQTNDGLIYWYIFMWLSLEEVTDTVEADFLHKRMIITENAIMRYHCHDNGVHASLTPITIATGWCEGDIHALWLDDCCESHTYANHWTKCQLKMFLHITGLQWNIIWEISLEINHHNQSHRPADLIMMDKDVWSKALLFLNAEGLQAYHHKPLHESNLFYGYLV